MTPHFKAFRTKPKIGNFRVFGCPASFKRYNATSRRTQTQQASRGIFIGFPNNQAGWLFYTEQPIGSNHIHVSRDATFDENFESALVFNKHPFQGSLAYRRTPAATEMQTFNDQTEDQSAGSVTDFITLPQDQSEEGNELDESSMSDENSVTEQTKIENQDENENPNEYDNEIENTNTDDVITDEN
jgi:membrane-bound lytic murein transglycosylase